jgi:hypothetical protein
MANVDQRATLDDLYLTPGKAELIGGRIVEFMPTGRKPNRVAGHIYRSLDDYATQMKKGEAFTPQGQEGGSPQCGGIGGIPDRADGSGRGRAVGLCRFEVRKIPCGDRQVHAGNSVEKTQPLSSSIRGGGDEDANLIYACFRCNQYKSDYVPSAEDAASGRRILHPHIDNPNDHHKLNPENGLLVPIGNWPLPH